MPPLSLEEEAKLLAREESGESDPHLERFRERVLRDRLESVINGEHGPDLAYAFRHGRMDALEIRGLLAVQFPDYANHPVFLMALYHELAPQDPRRAEVLLASYPEKESNRIKYEALDRAGYTCKPAIYQAFMESIPTSGDPADDAARWRVTKSLVGLFSGSHGSDFTPWVADLPSGTLRDWTLAGLACHFDHSDPEQASLLRSLIQDPRLRDLR